MAFEYVKHNRQVTAKQIDEHGQLATHDIQVPILLAYELGTINDAKGTRVSIDADFINSTMKATNDWIKKKASSPFARFRSNWSKPIDQIKAIPIIKNHDTSDVDGVAGHIVGLLFTESVDGILALKGKAVITDLDAKSKITQDLLSNTSLATRADGSIKEVSFVINEAIPLGGLEMSESKGTVSQEMSEEMSEEDKQKQQKAIQLQEEIAELQFQERELDDIIIPNHIILSKMIRSGKLAPWKYDSLIKTHHREMLVELMEAIPAAKLGIMYGTAKKPQAIDSADIFIDSIINQHQTKTNKAKGKNQDLSKSQINIINQVQSFEERRTKELSHILELAEHSPEILNKYLKIELGEQVDRSDCELKDTLLSEYIKQSKDIKQQLKDKAFQFQEINT